MSKMWKNSANTSVNAAIIESIKLINHKTLEQHPFDKKVFKSYLNSVNCRDKIWIKARDL